MAKLCLHVLCVEMDFTIKCISNHTWTLMQTTGSIVVPNVAKCSDTVTMYQNTLTYVVSQKKDLNVKLVHARTTPKDSRPFPIFDHTIKDTTN